MRAKEFDNPKDNFVEMFRKFLPLAIKIIKLESLPRIVFEKEIYSPDQPTFGQYVNHEHVLYVGLANRHPNDILRTMAHELVHYKQDTEHKLNDMSGTTGSPEENEANAIAGIVMRHFNKRYPEFLKSKPVVSETWSKKYKRSIDCSHPKGFSQRAHCQGRKKNEDVEENFDKEAEAWRDWQLKMLPRKMEMLSKLVKGWVPSEEDHIIAIKAGYDAMRNTGDVKDAAKAISDTFNEIQRQQGVAEGIARGPKEKKLYELLSSWLHFISFKTVKVPNDAIDSNGRQILASMQKHYLGPVVNGMAMGEILKGDLWQNPKVIPHLLKYIYQGIPYIEERIKKFVKPSEQQNYLSAIEKIKQLYKESVAQYSQGVAENFADGRNPQDKGDSARHGIRKGMTIAQLKKIRSSDSASPRKKQLAHWQINMRQGRKK